MPDAPSTTGEVAGLFLRLGLTAFGGPAAHIAMMHREVVDRRKWLTETEFLDLLAAANLIPGPSSTELAIYIGYRRAGVKGLVLAGACFILPAAILCLIIAALYVRFGKLPVTAGLLYGVKPVVIAIVCQAVYRLAGAILKSRWVGLLAVAAAVVNFYFGHELLVLFGSGLLVVVARTKRPRGVPLLALVPGVPVATTAAAVAPVTLLGLFLVFLKIGAVLFGSGYVLLAFLQADLVDRLKWLTQGQLLDAVAVGQFTPGPVFTTATFIGYIVSGPWGAVVATVAIFLPAFVFVALTAPLLARLRKSKLASAFLDGINAGSLALMAVVTIRLGEGSLVDWPSAVMAVLSLWILFWKKNLNSAWLVLGGAAVGLVVMYSHLGNIAGG